MEDIPRVCTILFVQNAVPVVLHHDPPKFIIVISIIPVLFLPFLLLFHVTVKGTFQGRMVACSKWCYIMEISHHVLLIGKIKSRVLVLWFPL